MMNQIYIQLLNEETLVLRPTSGILLLDNRYQILPTENYDPNIEKWEFIPGTVVECVYELHEDHEILVARKGLYLNHPFRDDKYLILSIIAQFSKPVNWYPIAIRLSMQGIILDPALPQLLLNLAQSGCLQQTMDEYPYYSITEQGMDYIKYPSLQIRVAADYYCYPLWHDDEIQVGDIDPADLPLSKALIADLIAWSAAFDATLNEYEPQLTGFPSIEAEAQFYQNGYQLQQRVQKELGSAYTIMYYYRK